MNSRTTRLFLDSLDKETRNKIISAIAKHYETDAESILNEILHPEAEHLLDYLVGPERGATQILMQKHGF